MATPFELQSQLTYDLLRQNPLDEYAQGLVLLARTGAAQRAAAELEAMQQAGALERTKLAGEMHYKAVQAEADAAAKRAELSAQAAERRAEIREEAAEKRQQERLKEEAKLRVQLATEAQRNEVAEKYEKLGIARKKDEPTEEYLIRATPEANKLRAQQLYTALQQAEKAEDESRRIASEGQANFLTRRAEFAYDRVKSLLPKDVLAKAEAIKDPVQRKSYLDATFIENRDRATKWFAGYRKDIASAAGQYELAVQEADENLPRYTQEQSKALEKADKAAASLRVSHSRLMAEPDFAPAIPEYNRLIAEGGGVAPGAMLQGTRSRIPLILGNGGTAAERFDTEAELLGAPVTTTSAPAPASVPVVVSPPATPPELAPGPSPTGWIPDAVRGMAALQPARVIVPPVVKTVGLALRNAYRNLWSGEPTELPIYETPDGTVVPAPTPAEIAAVRGGIPVGGIPASVQFAPTWSELSAGRPVPPEIAPVPVPVAPVPVTTDRLALEQRLLDDYKRRTSPMFDPTMVNVPTAQEVIAARSRTNAPVSPTDAANALRARIAGHPKARMYPVIPFQQYLAERSLDELVRLNSRLDDPTAPLLVPGEITRQVVAPAELTAP